MEPVDAQSIENADFQGGTPKRAVVLRAEVLLDRLHLSPGVIDGLDGDNFSKAVTVFQRQNGLQPSGLLDADTWQKLRATQTGPVLTSYTIDRKDVAGPFVKKIPAKMEAQSKLKRLGYHDAVEELAEKFHVSERLLHELDKGAKFTEAGTRITVPDVAGVDLGDAQVTRIIVEKGARDLLALGPDDKLVAFFPASVGSSEKPAPSGTLTIRQVSKNPTYVYNPKYAFKGVHAKHQFRIRPGPNNPVGLVWIGLRPGEGYGIHGTPEPEKVGKTASHGCVRLTNWDALELADHVRKGVQVDFVD